MRESARTFLQEMPFPRFNLFSLPTVLDCLETQLLDDSSAFLTHILCTQVIRASSSLNPTGALTSIRSTPSNPLPCEQPSQENLIQKPPKLLSAKSMSWSGYISLSSNCTTSLRAISLSRKGVASKYFQSTS